MASLDLLSTLLCKLNDGVLFFLHRFSDNEDNERKPKKYFNVNFAETLIHSLRHCDICGNLLKPTKKKRNFRCREKN